MNIKNAAEEVAQLVIQGYEKGVLTESEAGSMLDALSPINESVLFEADENNEEPSSGEQNEKAQTIFIHYILFYTLFYIHSRPAVRPVRLQGV